MKGQTESLTTAIHSTPHSYAPWEALRRLSHKQRQNDKSLSLIPTQDSLKDILARKCQHVNSTVQRNTGVNLGTYTVMKP